jgi:GNAT superfamily N-acetyltransferase
VLDAAAAETDALQGWVGPGGGVRDATASSLGPRAQIGGFYIGAGLMTAWGDGGFRISGLDADVGRFSSVLEFPMDGTYFVLEAGIDDIGSGFGVHLRYGSSGDVDGTVVDTDYAWDLTPREFIKSLSTSDGESMFLTIDLSYCLVGDQTRSSGRLDVFGGYQMQDSTFEVSDVHTIIAFAEPVDYTEGGLAATYDMEFYGVRAGIRGELPVGRSSTISGYVAVLPFVQADGFGQWMLREKTLNHDATGWGLDVLVRYEYAVSPNVRLWGGVGYTRLKGTQGTDDQFEFSGEPIGRARLDELYCEYSFVMIGGEFRF